MHSLPALQLAACSLQLQPNLSSPDTLAYSLLLQTAELLLDKLLDGLIVPFVLVVHLESHALGYGAVVVSRPGLADCLDGRVDFVVDEFEGFVPAVLFAGVSAGISKAQRPSERDTATDRGGSIRRDRANGM